MQDLAAVGGGADPGRAMDGQARIGALDGGRVTGVDAHPYPDGRARRPLMAAQCPLYRQRAQDGLLRAGERDEERVALRIDLVARVADDGRADQTPVIGQNLHVPSRSAFTSRVEPSMSLNRKVTAPLGSSVMR